MKKLLTIGALLLGISTLGLGQEVTEQTTFSKSETHIYTRAGFGIGVYDEISIEGINLNDAESDTPPTEISLEVTRDITENLELGLGVAYQNHGNVGKKTFYYEDDLISAKMPSYNSAPVYVVGKYNFGTTTKGYKPYVKADLGISFNNTDDAEFDGEKIHVSISNGVYAGLGVGIEKDNFVFDLSYKFNQAKLKEDGESYKYNSNRVMMSVGYRFNI